MATLDDAIIALAPGAEYAMNNDDYQGKDFEWKSPSIPQPLKSAVYAKLDQLNIAEAKNNKLKEVTVFKNAQTAATIPMSVNFIAYNWQKDMNSKVALSSAAQNNTVLLNGVDWITADNQVVHLTSVQLSNLITAIGNFDTVLNCRCAKMKAYINTFPVDMTKIDATIAAINAINILNIPY